MGARLKINLALLAVFAMGLAASSYFARDSVYRDAREEVLRSAMVMMEASASMRHYTVAQVRPALPYDRKAFLPQSVPAFAATEIMTGLRKKYPDYVYKEAALNPTNLRNRAVEWESDLVNAFRNDSSRSEIVGERDTPTGRSLYLARPIKIDDSACLACHTTADMSPPAMVKIYGTVNGYGWKLNEVVGAQIVSIPMDLALQHANRALATLIACLTGVFAALLLAVNLLLTPLLTKA